MSSSLNIIFAGTPEFAAVALQALLNSSHNVIAVYTQPDRPAGRGRHVTMSAVKALAMQHHLPIHQPVTLRNEEEQKKLANLHADVMVVVAYGLLLPLPVLNAPRLGCINIHGSLLPRWRGAAPIQRAILAGDTMTGVTIMQMDEGLDTGPMFQQVQIPIEAHDTSETLYERLATLGATAMLKTLDVLGKETPQTQDNALATYAHKLTKEEAQLDFSLAAKILERAVRGLNPWPIAYTHCNAERLRVWEAEVINDHTDQPPGTIVHMSPAGIDIATGDGVLRLQKMQWPGGRVLSAAEIVNAQHIHFVVGNRLGASS